MNPPDRPPPSPPDDHPALSAALGWEECPNPADHARVEVALLEECIAAAALSAPLRSAPARCLAAIQSLTATRSVNGHSSVPVNGAFGTQAAAPPQPSFSVVQRNTGTPPRKRLLLVTGWGLAAALAVLTGWQTVRIVRLHDEMAAIKKDPNHKTGKKEASGETAGNDREERGPAAHGEAWNSKDPFPQPGHNLKPKSRNLAYGSIVVPDRPGLMRKLAELQRLEDSRLQQAPGLARTVVMELRQPGAKANTPARTTMLSDEVAGLIAAGMDKSVPASADKPPVQFTEPDKSRPADDLTIKEGLPNFSGFTLQDGVTLYHQNFPADDWQDWSGLHLLKNGNFYDDLNDILWKPVPGEGRRYSGSRPQEPVILDEQEVPPGTPAPAQPQAPAADLPDQGPLIWSIYDESRGEGRFVVSGLPPAPEGQAYQVWFEDARSPSPITAGLLPALDRGAGQVGFTLTPGISPVRYRITLEPSTGSVQPAGRVILTGP